MGYGITGGQLKMKLDNPEPLPYGGCWKRCTVWAISERWKGEGQTTVSLIVCAGFVKRHQYFTPRTQKSGGFAHGLSYVGKRFTDYELIEMGFKLAYDCWMNTAETAIMMHEPLEGTDY